MSGPAMSRPAMSGPPAATPAGRERQSRVCQYPAVMPVPYLPTLPVLQAAAPSGDPSADVYQRLLRERIVFLGTEVDDRSANLICAQLLLLAAEDAGRDVSLYINSPGGSVTAGLAIYDTMQYVPCDVSTLCMGLAASMGQFLLCCGHAREKVRPPACAYPHAPAVGADARTSDGYRHPGGADRLLEADDGGADFLPHGQTVERIERDSDRDRWFTADEAKDYGFIDQVISKARQVGEPALA